MHHKVVVDGRLMISTSKMRKRLERLGHTTDSIPDTPLHLIEFDGGYIRDFEGEMLMRPPVDTY
jgi:hypothetical protein